MVGVLAGLGIGIVASVMGVAGGELPIPSIVLIYGLNVEVSPGASLMVSVPTMLMAFARYSRDGSFVVLHSNRRFVVTMAAGSIAGALVGGLLVGVIPDGVLIPTLAAILLISAAKVWNEGRRPHPASA